MLDRAFSPVGFVDAFHSLIWDRRYYEPGRFELHLPGDVFPLLQQSAYLYCKDFAETGVVEGLGFSQEAGGEKCYAKGRFLEALLDRRVIHTMQTLRGTPEEVIRQLVQTFAGGILPGFGLGPLLGGGTRIEMQATGGSLLDRLCEIAQPVELAIRLGYDYLTSRTLFMVWQGIDRTADQDDTPRAVFSDAFENVTTSSYARNDSDYKNYAYVAGAGEGTDRLIVPVDHTLPGEDRREVWVDARDLRQEEGMTTDQYRATLKQRGEEKLAEYALAENVEAAVNTAGNLVYKLDFDLGDKCTYINNRLGISCDERITEITEIYEDNARTVEITFGAGEKTILKKVKRGV